MPEALETDAGASSNSCPRSHESRSDGCSRTSGEKRAPPSPALLVPPRSPMNKRPAVFKVTHQDKGNISYSRRRDSTCRTARDQRRGRSRRRGKTSCFTVSGRRAHEGHLARGTVKNFGRASDAAGNSHDVKSPYRREPGSTLDIRASTRLGILRSYSSWASSDFTSRCTLPADCSDFSCV